MRRYEGIRLGVTYESEFDCDSAGLLYNWTLFDSAGRVFPLPLVDTRRQTLKLPSKLLDYDTYTAIARVRTRSTECKSMNLGKNVGWLKSLLCRFRSSTAWCTVTTARECRWYQVLLWPPSKEALTSSLTRGTPLWSYWMDRHLMTQTSPWTHSGKKKHFNWRSTSGIITSGLKVFFL